MKDAPFGFMPCNLSAFIMGFLLKEQILSEKYTWSDGTVSDELSQQRFKDMVERVIKMILLLCQGTKMNISLP